MKTKRKGPKNFFVDASNASDQVDVSNDDQKAWIESGGDDRVAEFDLKLMQIGSERLVDFCLYFLRRLWMN